MKKVIGILFGLVTLTARAGPPYITDDPEPVDKGHGELYLASIGQWNRDGVSFTLPHVEFNYGPVENVQLHVIAPQVYSRPNDTGRVDYGYGDTEFGVKWRFIQEDSLFKGCPQVGTFPLIEFPTGDVHRGVGNGQAQEFIPIWMQKSWGDEKLPWTIYGGGGYEFNHGPGNENFGFFGAVLQKQVTENFAPGLEIFHYTPSSNGARGHTGFNLGAVYDFSEHWHLLLSLGRDFVGDTRLYEYAAIQLTF